jgi:hypothetical protein
MSLGRSRYLYHWYNVNDGYFEWTAPPPTEMAEEDSPAQRRMAA